MVLEHYDLAFISLYLFWGFFILLVIYLQRESNREGFPLVNNVQYRGRFKAGKMRVGEPMKKFRTKHVIPQQPPEPDLTGKVMREARPVPGSPLIPIGNPMQDGVGPAAYALRQDAPDLMFDTDQPKIVPLRTANEFYIAEESPDPRGYWVVGTDGKTAGTVIDAWVDRADVLIRYWEVEVQAASGLRRVLVPASLATFDTTKRQLNLDSVRASQVGEAPGIAATDRITLREEDRLQAYFASGHMYATPKRAEPFL